MYSLSLPSPLSEAHTGHYKASVGGWGESGTPYAYFIGYKCIKPKGAVTASEKGIGPSPDSRGPWLWGLHWGRAGDRKVIQKIGL